MAYVNCGKGEIFAIQLSHMKLLPIPVTGLIIYKCNKWVDMYVSLK